ncbi:MAG: hypothetical protein GEV11_26005, partial [Streptosporangiales bacterium]|nr:hypothetical protein [Streptosporangiales bacterium]
DFIQALVHGRFADAHELQARARHHGFAVQGRYGVHIVAAQGLLPASRHDLQRVAAMTRVAQGVESHPGLCTLATTVGSLLVVIRQLPGDTSGYVDAREEGDAILHFSRQLHRALRGHLGDDLRVTHGRSGLGAAGVATGYYEARVAMGLARHTGADAVCGYDDLRVFAAIKDVAAGAEGRAFAHEMLSALRGVQSQSGDLEKVVLTYIKAAGNLNAAARELKLHRNTMLYKLDRASRALRMDVRAADTQFMVWLAHHIDTLSAVTIQLEEELAPPSAEVL